MSEPKPKRRWFRFSLRALFALLTVVGIATGWVAHEFSWIRARHRMLEQPGIFAIWGYTSAPWSIRLLERGVPIICVDPDVAADASKIIELKQLFPEASITTPDDGKPLLNQEAEFAARKI